MVHSCCGVLNSSAVDFQMLTHGRRHRVCYEAADRTTTVTATARPMFLRCTDVYHLTADSVGVLTSMSEVYQSVAQLCCSVLNRGLAEFNVQSASQILLRVSLRPAHVSVTRVLITFTLSTLKYNVLNTL